MPDRRVLDHLDVARRAHGYAKAKYLVYGSADELLDASYEGLCRAARDWDEALTPDFAEYAFGRCLQSIGDELRRLDYMTNQGRRHHRAYWSAFRDLSDRGIKPTPERIAEALHITGRVKKKNLLYAGTVAYHSLSDSLFDAVCELPNPCDVASEAVWQVCLDQMRTAAKSLPPRLGYVYRRLYIDGAMVRTVAAELGVSQQYVSQQLKRQVETFLRDAICGESAA